MKPDELGFREYSDERELIVKCLAGDRNARELFVENYSKLVYYIIHRMRKKKNASFTTEEIEDLHNDVFLALLEKKLGQFDARRKCSLAGWVKIVTVSTVLGYLRYRGIRSKYTPSVNRLNDEDGAATVEVRDLSPGPEDEVLGRDALSHLVEFVEELPPREKLFLRLTYVDELPSEHVADIMHLSPNMLRVLKHRTLKKIKQVVLQ